MRPWKGLVGCTTCEPNNESDLSDSYVLLFPITSILSRSVKTPDNGPLSPWCHGFLSGDNGMNRKLRHLRLTKQVCVLDRETAGIEPLSDRTVEIAVRLFPDVPPP